jgi:hypothetical protein
MLLRPLNEVEVQAAAASANHQYLPAWPVVERLQRQKYQQCWMITQPSHAALAGEFASRLNFPKGPRLDQDLIRAIALHDAGWGAPDAQAIARSRSPQHEPPRSFLDAEVAVFLEAWTRSIETAQPVCTAGGYMVSRHFQRIAERRIAAALDSDHDRRKVQEFAAHESRRQKRLAAKQQRSSEELESLTDLLQFCDLLSLYVCSGALQSAEFPDYFGCKLRLTVEAGSYRLDPPVIETGAQFSVAALRHPATKEASGREINVRIL